MFRLIISLIVTLLLATASLADAVIPKANHMKNRKPGLCAWCTMETLGRTYGYKELEGFVNSHSTWSPTHMQILQELTNLDVEYRCYQVETIMTQHVVWRTPKKGPSVFYKRCKNAKEAEKAIADAKEEGTYWINKSTYYNPRILIKELKKDVGIGVTIIYPMTEDAVKEEDRMHMLIIVGIDDNEVRLVDSNTKPGVITHLPLYYFLEMWNGFAIILDPK